MQARSEAERRVIWPCLNVATWRREKAKLSSSKCPLVAISLVANSLLENVLVASVPIIAVIFSKSKFFK